MKKKSLLFILLIICVISEGFCKSKKKKNEPVENKGDTSLIELMRNGKTAEVKAAFDYQFDIHTTDSEGNTVLHIAAERNDDDLCLFLIMKGADPFLKNYNSDTPLHVAIKKGSDKVVKALISADPETLFSRDAKGRTALDLGLSMNEAYYDLFITKKVGEVRDTEGQSIVHHFVKTKNAKGIKECVKKGIPVSLKDNEGVTPLEIALEDLDDDISVHVAAELILGGAEKIDSDFAYFYDAVSERNYSTRLQDGQTPLHIASIGGHTAITRFLIENKANPSAQDSSGATPLHEAIRYGHLDIAEVLLKAGANPDATDNLGKTPAMLIVSKDKMLDTYRLLVKYHANLSQKDMFGDTILHTVSMINVSPEVVTFLVQNGAEVDAKNKEGSTPLCIAVQKNEVGIVQSLAENGADIHAQNAQGISPLLGAMSNSEGMLHALINIKNAMTFDSEGNTPLHIALIYDAPLSQVKYILEKTTDVNIRNMDGNSPLFLSVLKNRREVGELILQKGGDIFSTNTNSNSPLRLALKYSQSAPTIKDWIINSDTIRSVDGSGNTVLHYAAEWQYGDAIEYLLGRKADIKARNANGETVLFSAAKSNNPEIIQKIVDGGADLHARDNMGSSVIHISVRYDAVKSVEKFIKLGVDVNAQNTSGKTALSEAVVSAKYDVVNLLLQNGANPNSTDINGVTVLMDAIRGCNESAVKLLLEKGASPNVQDINGRNAYHEAAYMNDIEIIRIIRNAGGNPLARDKQGKTPFSIVMDRGNDVILEILGNDRNITDSDGNTPIHIIVKENGSVTLITTLLNYGFAVDSRNSFGYTALNLAIEKGDIQRVKALLENGANPFQMIDKNGKNGVTIALEQNKKDVIDLIVKYAGDKCDAQGNNILHYAAKTSSEDVIKSLIRSGVDKDKQNVSGDTPYILAERWKRDKNILKLLK